MLGYGLPLEIFNIHQRWVGNYPSCARRSTVRFNTIMTGVTSSANSRLVMDQGDELRRAGWAARMSQRIDIVRLVDHHCADDFQRYRDDHRAECWDGESRTIAF